MNTEVTPAMLTDFELYEQARLAKSSWTAEEKRLKARLLEKLGYDQDEPKPSPVTAVLAGEPVFEVRVGNRKGLDIKYLKEEHPDVYAECEKWTYPISIRSVQEAQD